MFFFTTLLTAGLLTVETLDTLQSVTVIADRGGVVSRMDTVQINHSQAVTDILLQSTGSHIGDYGGFAGQKTLSLRGMGSPHTAIYVDGVRVGNVQLGQGDIGLLGLENYSSIVIDYAQNSLSFVTSRPSFLNGRSIGGKVKLKAGSFGTFLPSARIDMRVSKDITLSANAEGIISKGNYKYGDGLMRENNDISQICGGVDIFGRMKEGDWHVKAWYNGSERGTPGSVSWPSTDRQKDRNMYTQGLLKKQFSNLYFLIASAKLSYDDMRYSSTWGDSRYGQTEAQLNTSHKFSVNRWLVLSFASCFNWDGLKSNIYSQQRFGTTEAITASFCTKWLKADVAMQYDGVFDAGFTGRNTFSPSVDLRLFTDSGLDIVAFARRAFRAPTFNELYYVGYGNPDLRPEDAWLTDIGIDWKRKIGPWDLKAKFDGYYNVLKNKIISAPGVDNPDMWLPYNVGRVRAIGADAVAGFNYYDGQWLTSFIARYGFQNAVDRTPDSDTFGQQLPFLARHSLSLNASVSIKGWSAEFSWSLRAGRMEINQKVPDWNTLDLLFRKKINLGRIGTPGISLSLKNITDNRYELISGYPMPGFSVMGGIEYKF